MPDQLVKRNAKLNDTIALILAVIQNEYHSDFVQQLASSVNNGNVLQSLFAYVNRNVEYRLDPPGHEKVYKPSTTVKNGFGDCKKMTVLIASVLKNLGIVCYVKHVFYSDQDFTHIYVIVPTQTGKGYVTLDPAQNTIFDNEVRYARANVYDLNGNQMNLYTGYRQQHRNFTTGINNAAASIMDDIEVTTGCPSTVGDANKDRLIDSVFLDAEEMISGIFKKKKDKDKKTKEERKEDRKEKLKNLGNKFKQVSLVALRGAFLGIVRVNLLKIATKLAQAWKKNPARVESFWKSFGGNISDLKNTIIAGSKERISGPNDSIGAVALAAAVGAALPVVLAAYKMLKELGVVGPEEEEKINEIVDSGYEVVEKMQPKQIAVTANQVVKDASITDRGSVDKPTAPPPGETPPPSSGSMVCYQVTDIPSLVDSIVKGLILYGFVFSSVLTLPFPQIQPVVQLIWTAGFFVWLIKQPIFKKK